MVLDLQRCGSNPRIPKEIHQQLRAEVTHPDTSGQALVDEGFHCGPGFLDRGVAEFDFAVGVGSTPTRWVPDGWIDVFQRNGKVHNVQVEIVQTPVGELFLADGSHAIVVVEGVPEFGDNEEVGSFDEAVFDCARDALAGFDFVAVVCVVSSYSTDVLCVLDVPQAPSKHR